MTRLERIKFKTMAVSQADIVYIKNQFERKLKLNKITRTEWLKKHGYEGRNSLLSNVLAGRAMNAEFLREIINYIK